MLFDVIDYNDNIIGQVIASDTVGAWDEALKNYTNILNVKPVVELGGSLPWAQEKVKEVYAMPITKEEKYLRWSEIIMDNYYKGLLSEEEKTEYLQWEFLW